MKLRGITITVCEMNLRGVGSRVEKIILQSTEL